MTGPDVAEALRRAGGLGAYFAMSVGADGPGWQPLSALTGGDALTGRVAFVRDALAQRAGADVETRVAASIHSLALVSRLLAPPLACAALAGVVPRWSVYTLTWQASDGGPVPLAATTLRGREVGDVAGAAAALLDDVVATVVDPVIAAFERLSVSRTILLGNVASALAGAAKMLGPAAPESLIDPRSIVTAMLADGVLAGTGAFGVDGRWFRRTSCCLFYRVPGGGTCGDCVLG